MTDVAGQREQTRTMLLQQPANRPAPGTTLVAGKGFTGTDFEDFLTDELDLVLVRPARADEKLSSTEAAYAPGCGPGSRNACWHSTPD